MRKHKEKIISKNNICNFSNLVFDINNGITYYKKFHLKSGLHINIKRKDGVLF